MKTRTIHDRDDPERRCADNAGTCLVELAEAHEPGPLAELFAARYPGIRRACRHALTPGVTIVSVDGPSGAVGYVSLAARAGPAAAIVGRHGEADLYLPRDPRIALRHLAVIFLPGARPRVRLLDLATGQGFEDERGVRQLALEADGPIFVRLGRYGLFLLESALARRLPADAEEAWAGLPARVYRRRTPPPDPGEATPRPDFGEATPRPDFGEARPRPEPVDRRLVPTQVSRIGAPRLLERALLAPGEPPLGELGVEDEDGGRELVRLGASAAERGVLVGRYERCATSILGDDRQPWVSRVHLLVIRLEGALHAIDTASTNGTWLDEEPVRIVRLEPGVRLGLGKEGPRLEWRLLN